MAEATIEDIIKLTDLKLKQLQIKELQQKLKHWEERRLVLDEERLNLDKLARLSDCLQSACIDEEKTIVGGEIKFKLVFSAEEVKRMKAKFNKILARL
jgi:hypothetical protein